jgi:hypothetical protein
VPLVLKSQIGAYDVDRIFMDAGSGINLIYAKMLRAIHISLEFLKPIDCSFHGIVPGSANYPLGRIALNVSRFMAVPHYTYLVLKMLGPKGIITVKGSFEVPDLCDKEFHKMAQNFGMIANYAEKVKSTTTEGVKLPEERTEEPEMKKPRVEASGEDKTTKEEEKATAA